jgi:hypothetical protein
MQSKLLGLTVIMAALVLICVVNASAQLMPRGELRKAGFGIEYIRPEYGPGNNSTSFVIFTDIWGRLSDKVIVKIELPYAHSNYESYFPPYYPEIGPRFLEDAFGNIHLGFQFGKNTSGPISEIGVWLPTASTDHGIDALISGVFTDINRFEAFRRKSSAFDCSIGYNGLTHSGISTHFNIGPTIWLNNKDYYSKGSELLFRYGGNLWYDGKIGGFWGGVSGVTILTEDNLFGHGRNAAQIDLGGNFNLGNARPGVQFSFPMTHDLDTFVDYVITFNIMIGFE